MVGRVSGQARLSIDKRSLSDWKSLAAEVTGTGQGVRVSDWGLGNVQYTLNKLANDAEIKVNLQDASIARRWLADGQFRLLETKPGVTQSMRAAMRSTCRCRNSFD